MANSVDPIFFKDLAGLDPGAVCKRVGCTYDEIAQSYELPAWGDLFTIFPAEGRIERSGDNAGGHHKYFDLFLMHYLLTAKDMGPSGQWISEKEIPGGATFFRGPHTIPTGLISRRYQNDINAFEKKCEQLRGTPLDLADAAYGFRITPRIPVAVLYWEGDEDFSPESKILYDSTIYAHFASDIIYALAVDICVRIAG